MSSWLLIVDADNHGGADVDEDPADGAIGGEPRGRAASSEPEKVSREKSEICE